MKFSSFRYLLKEGVRNLWTNRVMAFTSVGVLTTCLLIVGAAYMLTINVNSMVKFVESQNEMSAFAVRDATVETQQAILTKIKGMPNVEKVTYISPEEGMANMGDEMGGLIDDIKDKNPIPASYVIQVTDISRTAETKEAIQKIDGIEIVNASNAMADSLTGIRNIVTTLGSVIILALGIISLVIIANTIRATIFTRRKEINIMKFVGATNSFIRIPFLVEGFMLGLLSAAIAYLMIWGSYSYLVEFLQKDETTFLKSMFESVVPFSQIATDLMIFFGATGTVLGTFGSAISVRNHVKV